MSERVRVACVQVTATPDMAANIDNACRRIDEAAAAGARLVLLPENAALMAGGKIIAAQAAAEAAHPALAAFRAAAAAAGVWLLAGSIAVRTAADRLANRSILIDDHGAVVARYDKIHMFDVDLPSGESYRESETFAHGDVACLAETPWGPLAMTVCYDLRFPHLYRTLAQAGARLISIPSAFTRPTGRAHWHVLMRARAIETGCFVFAPAQCGTHYGKRRTYGHSLIIDPWGEILAEAGEAPEIIAASLDLARIDEARAMVPSLTHDRSFAAPALARAAAE